MREVLFAVQRARVEPERAADEPPPPVHVPGRRTWTQAIDWDALNDAAHAAPVQRREAWGAAPAADVVHAAAAHAIARPGGALPHAAKIQRLFGRHDVSRIEAHLGDDAAAAARAMEAHGFATGHHVVFAGAPDLFTAAHEAAHVIQQAAGVQLAGGVGEVGDRYEQHANAVAERVVRGESVEALLDQIAPAGARGAAPAAVQHMKRPRRGESPDERIDRLTAQLGPGVRAVVAALVNHPAGPDDGAVTAAYPMAAAASHHAKVAGNHAQAARLALHAGINGQAGRLNGLLNDVKIASGAELLGLLDHAKLASYAELTAALAEAKILSGAELTALLGSPKVAHAALLTALVRRPICPDSNALIAFFADAHVPSLAEVEREIASGAITAWNQWAGRQNVTDVALGGPAADLATLRAMTMTALYNHADANAAWHAGIAQAGDRDQIRALLDLLRNTDGALDGCGAFIAGDLYDEIGTRGGFAGAGGDQVRAYARAVRRQTTCPSDPQPTVAEALDRGRDVLLLEAALASDLLRLIFTPERLEELCAGGWLTDFLTYVQTCAPTFSAREGHEIRSYIRLRGDGVNPTTLSADLTGWVVNLHRFRGALLTALRNAVTGGNVGGLPVTVLVHTAHDRDGAFHRDRNLQDVVTRAGHHTLMLEGQGDLATVSGKLSNIAARAPGGKIANVMLVGHGQSQSIDITGTTDPDGREHPNGVDIERSAGRQFLRQLIDDMASGPAAHLVLDACHTDSNTVEDTEHLGTTASWQDDARKIRDHIRDNPSLAEYARSYAANKVVAQQIAVHGANGATRDGMEFIDGAGALTLTDQSDPHVSGTKLAYVEHGQDPKGVMRAVLEVWATTNRGAALTQAMLRREAVNDTDFRNQTVRTLFALIRTQYWASAPDIARMVDLTGAVKKLRYPEDCTLAKLRSAHLQPAELAALDRDLRNTDDWAREPYLSIVFDQELNRPATVVATLAGMTVGIRELTRDDRKYIGAGFPFAGQLPLGGVGAATVGQLTLAIIGLRQHRDAAARAFLEAYVAQQPPPVLPGHLGTLASLLRDLGPAVIAGPQPRDANLAIDGQPTKTLRVTAMTKQGTAQRDTQAYRQPDVATAAAVPIHNGAVVQVIGELRGWYAIEVGHQTMYVVRDDLAVP